MFISIVGVDGVRFGYFKTKLAVESLVLPWTVQRSTQFYDFILKGARSAARFPIAFLPKGSSASPLNPVEVAEVLVDLALEPPSGVPVPQVVASDDGRELDTACVLMRRLPGRPVVRPREGWPWLVARLADVLLTIYGAEVTSTTLGTYEPHDIDKSYPLPSNDWSSEVWQRCLRVFQSPPPDGPVVFLHRDYHPGNVIWSSSRRLCGVVDWSIACIGSPWADVAHCRFNLWRWHGEEAADAIVAEYERLRADLPPYHPYWDIATAMSIPWPNRESVLWSAVERLASSEESSPLAAFPTYAPKTWRQVWRAPSGP